MKTKQIVLEFMKETETSQLNSNEFVWEIFKRITWDSIINQEQFIFWPSVSWINRARRYIIKAYWIWKRTKADSEKKYIKEFCLNNIY